MLQRHHLNWLIPFCLSIAWILWPKTLLRDGEYLAVVTAVQGDVKLRAAGNFNWTPIGVGTKMFPLDSISTGQNSFATFQLADQTQITVPDDTQLKIQQQSLNKGVSIALARGGISVIAKADPPPSRNGKTPNSASSKLKAPLLIQTTTYNFDLTRLDGSFQMSPDAPLKVSNPENVRLVAPNRSINLSQLMTTTGTALADLGNTLKDIVMLPAPPSPSETPKPKPKELKIVADVDDPSDIQTFPELLVRQLYIYRPEAFSAHLDQPLILPARDQRLEDARWQALFKVQLKGSSKSIIIRNRVEKGTLPFTLEMIKSIFPNDAIDQLAFTIEPGIFRKARIGEKIRMSGVQTSLEFQSLVKKSAQTLKLAELKYVRPKTQWIVKVAPDELPFAIHIWNPSVLAEMGGFLGGSKEVSLRPLSKAANDAQIHLVRGSELIMSINNDDPKTVERLAKRLNAHLIFRGKKSSFLGNDGSQLVKNNEINYANILFVQGNEAIALDQKLLKSKAVARNFIKKMHVYFFDTSVEILYHNTDS